MYEHPAMTDLKVLVIDDEKPALDELVYLLEGDPRVASALGCDSAADALRVLQESDVDAVFLDVQMPGLTGLDLAQVLSRFKAPPPVVFVTAHEEHAERLGRRVAAAHGRDPRVATEQVDELVEGRLLVVDDEDVEQVAHPGSPRDREVAERSGGAERSRGVVFMGGLRARTWGRGL